MILSSYFLRKFKNSDTERYKSHVQVKTIMNMNFSNIPDDFMILIYQENSTKVRWQNQIMHQWRKKGHIHRVKIMYIGHWSFFFMTLPKISLIFMPPCFISSSKFLCHPFFFYAIPILKCLCHPFFIFISPSIFLFFKEKFWDWESISTFLTHILKYPHFLCHTLEKLKSFCTILCHPGNPYATPGLG